MIEFKRWIKSLPKGYFYESDVFFTLSLSPLVRKIVGDFLEVGSLLGKSSVVLGKEAQEQGVKHYCIDPWDPGEWKEAGRTKPPQPSDIKQAFLDNMEKWGVADTIEALQGKSGDFLVGWRKPLKFILIDGNHDCELAFLDMQWRYNLVQGGIFLVHDYCSRMPGVVRAVKETVDKDPNFEKIGLVHTMVAFTKREQ